MNVPRFKMDSDSDIQSIRDEIDGYRKRIDAAQDAREKKAKMANDMDLVQRNKLSGLPVLNGRTRSSVKAKPYVIIPIRDSAFEDASASIQRSKSKKTENGKAEKKNYKPRTAQRMPELYMEDKTLVRNSEGKPVGFLLKDEDEEEGEYPKMEMYTAAHSAEHAEESDELVVGDIPDSDNGRVSRKAHKSNKRSNGAAADAPKPSGKTGKRKGMLAFAAVVDQMYGSEDDGDDEEDGYDKRKKERRRPAKRARRERRNTPPVQFPSSPPLQYSRTRSPEQDPEIQLPSIGKDHDFLYESSDDEQSESAKKRRQQIDAGFESGEEIQNMLHLPHYRSIKRQPLDEDLYKSSSPIHTSDLSAAHTPHFDETPIPSPTSYISSDADNDSPNPYPHRIRLRNNPALSEAEYNAICLDLKWVASRRHEGGEGFERRRPMGYGEDGDSGEEGEEFWATLPGNGDGAPDIESEGEAEQMEMETESQKAADTKEMTYEEALAYIGAAANDSADRIEAYAIAAALDKDRGTVSAALLVVGNARRDRSLLTAAAALESKQEEDGDEDAYDSSNSPLFRRMPPVERQLFAASKSRGRKRKAGER